MDTSTASRKAIRQTNLADISCNDRVRGGTCGGDLRWPLYERNRHGLVQAALAMRAKARAAPAFQRAIECHTGSFPGFMRRQRAGTLVCHTLPALLLLSHSICDCLMGRGSLAGLFDEGCGCLHITGFYERLRLVLRANGRLLPLFHLKFLGSEPKHVAFSSLSGVSSS